MRARLDELVTARLSRGAAVPALTCYDFGTALAVVEAAEDVGQGVVLLVTPKTAATRGGLRYIGALRGLADAASVPVVVQLDHTGDLDLALAAVAAGADAVMADGSALPLEQNIAFVVAAREATAAFGTVIEAELGSIPGDEDRAMRVRATATTDPQLVAPFLAATGAHLLATSIGNVHGHYAGEPKLDWALVEHIRGVCVVPLSLHGASGLPESDLARAGASGLGKVNINTELRTAVLTAVQDALPAARAGGDDLFAVDRAANRAAHDFALGAFARLAR